MELTQELNRIKNRIGLVGGSLRIHEYDDAEENVAAHINHKDWNIEFTLKKGYNPINDRRQRAYARKKKIQDGRRQLLEDILHHELGHWELPFNSGYGCPYDSYHSDLILEAVKKALPKDKQQHSHYVANAFADLLVNTRAREFTGNFAGQVLFFDEQGVKMQDKGYTPFYEAFVRLNMNLWGDNTDKALVKRHLHKTREVDEAVKEVMKSLSLEGKVEDSSVLFEKKSWPRMARDFANAMAPLLDVSPQEQLSPYHGQPQDNGNERKQQPAGNGIEEKAGTKQGKEDIAYGRYKSNKGLSPNIESYEQLDSLYRRLARAIPVKVEAITREQSLAISPLNFRPFDPEKDDIRKAKPTKLYLTDNGITFGYQRTPITVTEKSKVQRRSFPDFKMVVLDNSGSMALSPENTENVGSKTFIPWGDNSKYHYALLGFYGIEQFLQAQGIAQYIGYGLSLFSSSTRYEESDFKNIKRLRRLALSPEFGSTTLDARVLLSALKGRESFVLSISDGEIGNWDSAKQEFDRLASENYFGHIQIGRKNQFTSDLESKGFPVFYVNSGDELSRLMVHIASDTYRRFVKT